MRRYGNKLLTSAVLAVYGAISLLGHGLHWLAPEEGHHHGTHVVACAAHGHDHHPRCHRSHRHECHDHHAGGSRDHYHGHHHHAGQPGDREGDFRVLAVRANECGTHSHECEICNFLSQARGERAQLVAAAVWQPLVVAAAPSVEPSYWLTARSQHAPRGPPLVG